MAEKHISYTNFPMDTTIYQKEERNKSSSMKNFAIAGTVALFGLGCYSMYTQNEKIKRKPQGIKIENDSSNQ